MDEKKEKDGWEGRKGRMRTKEREDGKEGRNIKE